MERLSANPLVTRLLSVIERKIGMAQLAAKLGVAEGVVREWRDGQAVMPERAFTTLVDLLTDLVPTWEDWDHLSH